MWKMLKMEHMFTPNLKAYERPECSGNYNDLVWMCFLALRTHLAPRR
jgi:hypothetical protein